MLSILAILFDPLFLLMAMVAVSLGSNKNYIIPVTGVFIGVFAETLAMKVSPGHLWGDSFPTFMAAGIVQAIMAYFVVHWWKSRKHQAECGTQSDISGK
ncbi:hypothetical protein ACH42_11625 [Endozoicomonas sp. (ex Bugula neritina AB1)]|nr:hypothetical protein ACH42_11625 [Endozoicomonas sp. (ex Bugula neritina AB1)]